MYIDSKKLEEFGEDWRVYPNGNVQTDLINDKINIEC